MEKIIFIKLLKGGLKIMNKINQKLITSPFYKIPLLILFLSVLTLISGCENYDLGDLYIPSVRDIKDNRPLTTNLNAAENDIPFLDDFNPSPALSLFSQPRLPGGEFLLKPGVYKGELQSYCLHAGTYGPGEKEEGEGNGYIYAPFQGKHADVIRSILRNSYRYPEIPQRNVQKLIWAVLARAKIEDLSKEDQLLAAKLLSSEQISIMNRDPLELIPARFKEKAMSQLPLDLSRIIKAEDQLRKVLYSAQGTYQDLEEIAVLTGTVPQGEGSRYVPSGRWSYHPDGYYIKYDVHSYPRTEVTIYNPAPFVIERDHLNRITAIEDDQGNRIETDYDDTVDPLIVAGDDQIRGYAFNKIRFIRPNSQIKGGFEIIEVDYDGWTYVGIPNGRGEFPEEESSSVSILDKFRLIFTNYAAAQRRSSRSRFSGRVKRYHGRAKDAKKLKKYVDARVTPVSKKDIENITDIGHYEDGLDTVENISDIQGRAEWINDHLNIVRRAWAYCNKILGGLVEEDEVQSDPSNGVAVSGNTSKQLIGISGRGF